MDIQAPTPKRLSLFLTLMAIGGVIIFVVTLLFVAVRLAAEFNASARVAAEQRVERGLESVISDLEASSIDYSEWTAHYHALQRQDYDWVRENVGAAVWTGALTQIVVLAGGPLDTIYGWSAEAAPQMGAPEYQEIAAFTSAHVAAHDIAPEDHPFSTIRWVGESLWLITANLVVPHTEDAGPVLPTATLLFGVPLYGAITERLGHTLLLADVDIQTAPGEPGASMSLDVEGGPPAWVTWALPSPGTDAVYAVAAPIGVAIGVLILVVGVFTFFVRRLTLQLEYALTTVAAASKAKSDFLSTMSHELRTPLNGVLGMADLLADTTLTKKQRELLDTIQLSGAGLLSLVNDILDLARVESGKLALDTQRFALARVLARLESVHNAMAQNKGIAFSVRRSKGCDDIRLGDEMRIIQILHNVIGNAVKFTETGSVILDVSANAADELVFRVIDTGIGMTNEQVARVFDAFEQADAGITRRFGGTGLGMSIVRRLIDAMDGKITVVSAPGKGTTVEIRLPVPRAEAAEDPAPTPADTEFDELAFREMLSGCKVLVAEDNATNRKIMATMLDTLGVEAAFAGNGLEACKLWNEEPFCLVLMDISMPVMDGMTALETMRRLSEETGRDPPRVIAATANVMKTQTDTYRAKGFVDVLPKPYKRAQLQQVLFKQMRLAKAAS